MPTETTLNDRARALNSLKQQIELTIDCDLTIMRPMYTSERVAFERKHPGAHFVIGDFEIRCLCPEKYGL